jgi:hypothetical protein
VTEESDQDIVNAAMITGLLDKHGIRWEITPDKYPMLVYTVQEDRHRVPLPARSTSRGAWRSALTTVRRTLKPLQAKPSAVSKAKETVRYRDLHVSRQAAYILEYMLSGDRKAATLASFHKDVRAIEGVEPVSLSAARELLADLFRPKSKSPAEPLQLD